MKRIFTIILLIAIFAILVIGVIYLLKEIDKRYQEEMAKEVAEAAKNTNNQPATLNVENINKEVEPDKNTENGIIIPPEKTDCEDELDVTCWNTFSHQNYDFKLKYPETYKDVKWIVSSSTTPCDFGGIYCFNLRPSIWQDAFFDMYVFDQQINDLVDDYFSQKSHVEFINKTVFIKEGFEAVEVNFKFKKYDKNYNTYFIKKDNLIYRMSGGELMVWDKERNSNYPSMEVYDKIVESFTFSKNF